MLINIDDYHIHGLDTCYNKYGKFIDIILEHYDESEYFSILRKIVNDINCLNKTNCLMEEYVRLGLYRLPQDVWIHEYLFDHDTYMLSKKYNHDHILKDKYSTYCMFKEYYKRDAMYLTNVQQTDELIQFVKKYKKIVIKPNRGSLGKDVDDYVRVMIKKPADVQKILDRYDNDAMVEECIVQHNDTARYNPHSVNTFRITYIGRKVFVMFRTGITTSIGDGVNHGGITCSVNENGEIIRAINGARQSFNVNPKTGEQLIGSVISGVNDAIKMTDEIMDKLKNYHYIGFDVAKLKNGDWCIVEINNKPSIVCVETALDKGLKNEL